MPTYYIDKKEQQGGKLEVHKATCIYMPKDNNKFYLGYFTNYQEAIEKAKKYFSNVEGCFYCCRDICK